ncbi:MAG: hypothetical protein KG003_06335 [Bacteroidetes bacterium]|nr:hypothetical protein [Bacteroidota bacterium]
MSFKRTAISLITIALVTAGVAAVYLWYNFNSRSNLITVVPMDCKWYYHIQTKEIRNKTSDSKPKYLDSIAKSIKNLPAFRNVKDPGDVGISLYSDIILFENSRGRYLVLSVTSEQKLQHFFTEILPKNFTGGLTKSASCNFAKADGKNLYFAFKHKAFVVFEPFDTTDNLQNIENGIAVVFEEKSKAPITSLPVVQFLYENDCDIVFYSNKNKSFPTHGIQIKNNAVLFSENTKYGFKNYKNRYVPFQIVEQNLLQKTGIKPQRNENEKYLDQTMSLFNLLIKNYWK